MECLANTCMPEGSDPVASPSTRHVLDPTAIGIVAAHRPRASAGLPPTVSFGSRVGGGVAWYMSFEPDWPPTDRVDRAFLILSPPPGSVPVTKDVRLAAWRVAAPWNIDELTYDDQPPRAPPRGVGIASSTPAQIVRIDVTGIVQYWQRHPRDRHGIAVEAPRGDGPGVGFCTGAGGGDGPRLDVYVVPRAQ